MKVKRICIICKTPFERKLDKQAILHKRGKTCSVVCGRISMSIKNKKGRVKKCLKCGTDFYAKKAEEKRGGAKYCKRSCFQNVGGKCLSVDGYYLIRTPHGQMKEHRYLMEQFLGRRLLSSEIVHHINENKLDNRLENLELTTRSLHNSHHFKGKKKGKKRVP